MIDVDDGNDGRTGSPLERSIIPTLDSSTTFPSDWLLLHRPIDWSLRPCFGPWLHLLHHPHSQTPPLHANHLMCRSPSLSIALFGTLSRNRTSSTDLSTFLCFIYFYPLLALGTQSRCCSPPSPRLAFTPALQFLHLSRKINPSVILLLATIADRSSHPLLLLLPSKEKS